MKRNPATSIILLVIAISFTLASANSYAQGQAQGAQGKPTTSPAPSLGSTANTAPKKEEKKEEKKKEEANTAPPAAEPGDPLKYRTDKNLDVNKNPDSKIGENAPGEVDKIIEENKRLTKDLAKEREASEHWKGYAAGWEANTHFVEGQRDPAWKDNKKISDALDKLKKEKEEKEKNPTPTPTPSGSPAS